MHVVVFGANGKVGSLVVAALLKKGYQVTAFIHGHNNLPQNPSLTVVTGDIKNSQDVSKALEGATSVISALGSWGTPTKDILTEGMKTIIPAMRQHGIKRIVSLTGSAAYKPGDHWGVFAKLARRGLMLAAPKILQDGERHIRLLMDSDLAWTVLRSPVMSNSGSDHYILNDKVPGALETINRAAVAQALVNQLSDELYVKLAPHLHRAS
jgi:nucleoside-diphosphate-sugar epimerase